MNDWLNGIRQRLEAITPEPWVVGVRESWGWPVFSLRELAEREIEADRLFIEKASRDVRYLLRLVDTLAAAAGKALDYLFCEGGHSGVVDALQDALTRVAGLPVNEHFDFPEEWSLPKIYETAWRSGSRQQYEDEIKALREEIERLKEEHGQG